MYFRRKATLFLQNTSVRSRQLSNSTFDTNSAKRGLHFVAPIPKNYYILINDQKTVYVPTDRFLLKESKFCDKITIYKRLHPTYLISDTHTCENQIIRAIVKQLDYKICQVSPLR